SAARHGIADRLQRLMQHRHRLRQVDDVNVVAGAEDVLRHLRIPAVGLMTEMNASFQKLAHAEVGQRHVILRLIRRGPMSPNLVAGHRTAFKGQGPRVKLPGLYREARPGATSQSVSTVTTPETALMAPAICGEILKRPGSLTSTSLPLPRRSTIETSPSPWSAPLRGDPSLIGSSRRATPSMG